MGDSRELEKRLDEALRSYVAQAPRPGLERRVLARVNAEARGARIFGGGWRIAALGAVAAAVVAVLCIFAFRGARQTRPATIAFVPRSTAPADSPALNDLSHVKKAVPKLARAEQKKHVRNASPKKQIFPTPQPLSPEERLLLAYVTTAADTPKQAPILAKEPIVVEPIRIAAIHIDPLPSVSGTDRR